MQRSFGILPLAVKGAQGVMAPLARISPEGILDEDMECDKEWDSELATATHGRV